MTRRSPLRFVIRLVCSLAWSALVCLTSLGCASKPTTHKPLPTLQDIRPAQTQPVTTLGMPQTPSAPMSAYRLDLPLRSRLDKAWAMVTPEPLPTRLVDAWKANGIRVGVIDAAKTTDFLAALPRTINTNRQILLVSENPSVLIASPPLRRRVQVLTPDDILGYEKTTVQRGQVQILARLMQPDSSLAVVMLTPHHFLPHETILPRSPLEKLLDGEVFVELTLAFDAGSDKVLVIGLEPPEPPPAPPASQPDSAQPDEDTTPLQTTPADTPDAQAPQPELAPAEPAAETAAPLAAPSEDDANFKHLPLDRLGPNLVAGQRLKKPVQTILLITVQPVGAAPPSEPLSQTPASQPDRPAAPR